MPNTLYILDGHAQIYRAYYAVMGLTSPTGEPTNATFGFVGMLTKLLQARRPSHVVMAMDAPGEVFRSTIDSQYKAQRKPMPEDMPQQIDRISQIVELLGIPILQCGGFEADDVIATLVRQVCDDKTNGDGCQVYMCTKDKDLDQLITDHIKLFDIQTNEEIDPAGLFAKKGYHPNQARDVLALTGDTVDNIPGIPGVGPKTAAKWIAQFGSIDNLIANQDQLAGKIGETFRANLHVLAQSRQLVELRFDVPIQLDWSAAKLKPEKLPLLAPIFRELGFNRMLTTLDDLVKSYRAEIGFQPPPAAATPSSASGAGVSSATATPQRASPPKQKKVQESASMAPGLFDHLEPSPEPRTSPNIVPATIEEAALDEPEAREPAPPSANAAALKSVAGDYRLINTPQLLDEMLADLSTTLQSAAKPWLAVDTETDALGAMCSNLCGISLSAKIGTGYYVAVKGTSGDVLDPALVRSKLGPMLSDPAIRKVGQNLKYDLNALRVFGIHLAGVYMDTMVASYVLDSSRLSHGMDSLAADLLGLQPIPISDLIGKGAKQVSFADVPLDRAAQYSAEDADVTLRLAHLLYGRLVEQKMENLFFDVEMPLVLVLADMEFCGVKIDAAILNEMAKTFVHKLADLAARIRAAAGVDFNLDSPRQLADVLFNQLKLPIIRKNKTGPSTDIDVLERLADKHPVPALIVEYRQLTKLKNTYLEALAEDVNPRTGRVHASFNQTVAATGRLSSSDPNLQNIPIKTEIGREIRRAFVAPSADHVLITADYSQIELRVLAHFCQEPALLEAFAANRDVHRVVASEIFKVPEDQVTPDMRGIAKTVNFGIIYGQSGFGLSHVLKIPQQQANEFIAAYKKRFPQIDQFNSQCIQQATMQEFVTTLLGRKRAIPDINSPIQSRRQFGQRAALNSVIQGSAADLIKLAMVNIHRKIQRENRNLKLIMQIHDELVLECPRAEVETHAAMVRQEMEHALELKTPLKVDMDWGPNWLEGK